MTERSEGAVVNDETVDAALAEPRESDTSESADIAEPSTTERAASSATAASSGTAASGRVATASSGKLRSTPSTDRTPAAERSVAAASPTQPSDGNTTVRADAAEPGDAEQAADGSVDAAAASDADTELSAAPNDTSSTTREAVESEDAAGTAADFGDAADDVVASPDRAAAGEQSEDASLSVDRTDDDSTQGNAADSADARSASGDFDAADTSDGPAYSAERTAAADDSAGEADSADVPAAADSADAPAVDDSADAPAAADSSDVADDTVSEFTPEHLEDDEFRSALEAMLLVVDAPAPVEQLAAALDDTTERVDGVLRELSAELSARGSGIDLRFVGDGWRFYTRSEYAPYVERVLLDGARTKLTRAALETLAVVAYRQPVTRTRVSAVRGVNVDGVMRTLLARGLIAEAGIDPETNGTMYATTELFLERIGLASLTDLPPLAPLLPGVDLIDEINESLDTDPRYTRLKKPAVADLDLGTEE